ncbi:uncharacterized protein MELLADRAFT_91129 [Melampsora larici-populina 98AG31]|uniref:Uncharacterized protein n=1 Tax=Melampsora larici-populina (strain 98AG31 / pathotype 3-4-7) TaxID=747676 RepID=F4R787_MELLP|nr:uncharacterized protein MELLADRAFT_91129 [Melampsora larici-populina 98AG31]EGG11563.1 hypothetical protein MELLADRAFT_91129 [Melampsora larici-populina 98AG31]
MSYVHTSIFLPKYILESVIDGDTPRIDPETFLSNATPTKLLEVILAFYPHYKFTKNSQKDHELLRLIFVEMVAPRLRNVAIPSQNNTKYIEAPLHSIAFVDQEPDRNVNLAADLELKRTSLFNNHCLPYLKNGKYRRAVGGLETFCKTYKTLNVHELNSIGCALDEASEDLQDCHSDLTEFHTNIESIHLKLHQPGLQSEEEKNLHDRLKIAITTLRSHQIAFNQGAQNVGLITALKNHYRNYPSTSEKQDSDQDSHSNTPQDT